MNHLKIIFLFILTLFLASSCNHGSNQTIDIAYHLAAFAPDSALSLLQGMRGTTLSLEEQARYALVYTMAQDKSGLDVDNDSLLRAAYTYYNNRPDDSLSYKCEYYMGKYYMLNDSSELAIVCFQKSAEMAKMRGDKYTQCLAWEKMSKIMRQTDPKKAVELARRVENIYTHLPRRSNYNIVYSKLNVGMALLMADSAIQADEKYTEALQIAKKLKDSIVLSDVYQDMALVAKERRNFVKALAFSKASFDCSPRTDISKGLNLAEAYLDADSMAACNKILKLIRTEDYQYKYILFHLLHLASIKSHHYQESYEFADSAYHYLDLMYGNQLQGKIKYYNALTETKYENGVIRGESRQQSLLTLLTIIFSFIFVMFICFSYIQYRKIARYKLMEEKRKNFQQQKLHDDELSKKEGQMAAMRHFILRKIDTPQKIKDLKEGSGHVSLSDADWDEIGWFLDIFDYDYVKRLHDAFPNLEEYDIRLLMLIRLKMPAKALARIYNIGEKSIKQKLFLYKAKVGIEQKSISLRKFIESF